jgi:hypothetical protein
MITPYRLKHIPTGLYYQPTSNLSNLSFKGKIYQTNVNGISEKINYNKRFPDKDEFRVDVKIGSRVYSHLTKNCTVILTPSTSNNYIVYLTTKLSEWVKEEIVINKIE